MEFSLGRMGPGSRLRRGCDVDSPRRRRRRDCEPDRPRRSDVMEFSLGRMGPGSRLRRGCDVDSPRRRRRRGCGNSARVSGAHARAGPRRARVGGLGRLRVPRARRAERVRAPRDHAARRRGGAGILVPARRRRCPGLSRGRAAAIPAFTRAGDAAAATRGCSRGRGGASRPGSQVGESLLDATGESDEIILVEGDLADALFDADEILVELLGEEE